MCTACLQEQGNSDAVLDDVACMLGCTRSSLHGANAIQTRSTLPSGSVSHRSHLHPHIHPQHECSTSNIITTP